MSGKDEKSWDGTDRRQENKVLIDKVDRIHSFLEREFGGQDLSGNEVEGNTTKQLRELNEKVGIQNGRVTKLENWKSYLTGGIAILGIGFCAMVVAVVDIVFKTSK